jgi:hypothetical protein
MPTNIPMKKDFWIGLALGIIGTHIGQWMGYFIFN